jgi:transcriptional regulator with GAF, ATPase, and Fis domain
MKKSQTIEAADDPSLILNIAEAIATIKDRESLYKLIFTELQKIFKFEIAGVSILDKDKTHLEIFLAGTYAPAELLLPTIRREKIPLKDSFFVGIMETLTSARITIAEMMKTARFDDDIETIEFLRSIRINEMITTPMLTSGDIIGFLMIGLIEEQSLPDKRLPFFQKIANQVALSVKINIAYDQMLQREHMKNILLKMNNVLASLKDRDQLFIKFAEELNNVIPFNYIGIVVKISEHSDPITACFVRDNDKNFVLFPTNKNQDLPILTLKSQIKQASGQRSFEFLKNDFKLLCKQSTHFRILNEQHGVDSIFFSTFNLNEAHEISLIIAKSELYSIFEWEAEFINHLLSQFTLILNNYFAFEEINYLKKQLEQEKTYLLEEINLTDSFQEIIGASPAIQNVLYKIKQVAPLDATVLIQGETGTGKELIARAIHNLSRRKDFALVKVNCAALPAQLIESELFGHEKGSFTGAIERRIGKFELANGGTIFLDEIGEMPYELQAKLLRVLQENEFERVGGKSAMRTDVRVIAATNRNLEKEVEAGRFRSDLFFRLNVFPLTMPPLRQRLEDIPLFVKYFMEKYSKRIGKNVLSIKKTSLDAMKEYNWPGNIRELEHLIERAIIISTGQTLEIDNIILSGQHNTATEVSAIKPLIEVEREHIVNALKATRGKVTGENGAAALLGLNGKTLGSRMRKLGIKREVQII